MVVKHGIEIERRAHRTADLAERLELFDRPTQLRSARLQLVEQPCVLDRDDGLVGEGLEHGDLPFRKHRGFGASDRDHSNWAAVAKHRHSKDAQKPDRLSHA